MVDMSTRYDETIPNEDSNFGSIRDSFYILICMNQYVMKPVVSLKKEAEGLLRIVLFSKDLRLLNDNKTLDQRRRKLAQSLRCGRRRGVVPVYISTLWFIFALALSIQTAFGYIGENSIAHDLALGCVLSWLPVLILCSIVDRNPIAVEDIRNRLNELVDKVCLSLRNDQIRQEYIETFRDQQKAAEMRDWVQQISDHSQFVMGGFFGRFAGQGRVRWHYGAAHPILSDIENSYIAERGRNWLENEEEARTNLVLVVLRGASYGSIQESFGRSLQPLQLSLLHALVRPFCRTLHRPLVWDAGAEGI